MYRYEHVQLNSQEASGSYYLRVDELTHHTHTHTRTKSVREREREREVATWLLGDWVWLQTQSRQTSYTIRAFINTVEKKSRATKTTLLFNIYSSYLNN